MAILDFFESFVFSPFFFTKNQMCLTGSVASENKGEFHNYAAFFTAFFSSGESLTADKPLLLLRYTSDRRGGSQLLRIWFPKRFSR